MADRLVPGGESSGIHVKHSMKELETSTSDRSSDDPYPKSEVDKSSYLRKGRAIKYPCFPEASVPDGAAEARHIKSEWIEKLRD